MRRTVYVETSIFSYLAGRPSRDLIVAARQQLTHTWWRTRRSAFDLYVSQVVLDEVTGILSLHRDGPPWWLAYRSWTCRRKSLNWLPG